jgi:4,5-DOPA dioxygenase extradiol
MDSMPALFLGHGNPMNALQSNGYTRAWAALARQLPRPRAILCVSAHWYAEGTAVTAMARPRTIHDFGGFPRELYDVTYPAPGDAALAARVAQLLAPLSVDMDESWGLDHGAWSVLCHMFPAATIPVVQLRIDETQPPALHYELGKRLSALRDEEILIVGSGNVVHNLHAYAWGRHSIDPFDWAARFESRARELLLAGDTGPLVDYEMLGPDATLSVPTPEHYLPLLYVVATRRAGERILFPIEGFDGGSISMLAVQIGC